ncbi:DEAD/DEAH box helicase [Methylibium petroleiphilum]|uniref:Conserved hypothetical ATP-dependent helicase n=1 Tax=Methylibium petroleiphilum (strain ATCC BAA-1232 / LMG 22953 / PM1) TaxID=420662 RepID=A2SNG2_METPP|nr:DEAD/DEAH box helicase [Methylibium petroleiphilum]ABM97101.1 conserved hypothetical ATP-dependent helicase [Methylibium petroleiphilum PM1]
MSDSKSFFLLDERIRRFIWTQGWDQLRPAQEAAIPLIVEADRDVIVAAATAAGKTEAAMLPALTHLLRREPADGLVVYVSPLKALINDQFGRLEALCADLDIPVWPWHGDIASSQKTRFLKAPRGVLLITPESLEALLVNRGHAIAGTLARLAYVVIDELHSFIGSERGKQLQSLMHRIDLALGRRVPRVGLSATLGDMNMAADFLRPGCGRGVAMVNSGRGAGEVKVIVKGYEEPFVPREGDARGPREPSTPAQVAQHMYGVLRGANNLVFPNSRREVERYTHLLNSLCKADGVPPEFWPHHGSLSKEIRTDTEAALKRTDGVATAICTNTLELGIDIGPVKSVAQVGPPSSVAGLRQRLGRSGRRKGEPAILRGYSIEDAVTVESDLDVRLRVSTVQLAAMVGLALEGWFEPPVTNGAHLSTLVQQLMSLIAQRGGVMAAEAYRDLCGPQAPFSGVGKADFAALLRHLASKDLIVQEEAGLLLHGGVGERIVNHYSFYAAFAAEEEYRLISGGRPLGTLPLSQALVAGQRILFAGRTWRVDEVAEKERTIYVTQTKGGAPPLFTGESGRVHTRVRQRMREILRGEVEPGFLDPTAARFVAEARRAYADLQLDQVVLVDSGAQVRLFTWLGDAANEAIVFLLLSRGLTATLAGPGIDIQKGEMSEQGIAAVLADLAGCEIPQPEQLLAGAANIDREKWDWALPDVMLRRSYASLRLDPNEASAWLAEHAKSAA